MIDDLLEEARKEYIKTEIPAYLKHEGWNELRLKLELVNKPIFGLFFGRGLVFASLVLALFGAVVGIAQASGPGDGLYSVKVLSDRMVAKLTGNYEAVIQKRADDVINVTNNDPDSAGVDQAKKQYERSLDEAKNNANQPEQQNDLKQTLDSQEQKFKEEINKNPQSGQQLQDVLDKTEKTNGEIKGVKSENDSSDKNQGQQGQNENRQDGSGQSGGNSSGRGNSSNGDHGR